MSRRNELGGAVIPISVRRSVHVSVYGIIAKSPIRRHHHTSIYFRVFVKMLFHFHIQIATKSHPKLNVNMLLYADICVP